jgi:hypothetical protein
VSFSESLKSGTGLPVSHPALYNEPREEATRTFLQARMMYAQYLFIYDSHNDDVNNSDYTASSVSENSEWWIECDAEGSRGGMIPAFAWQDPWETSIRIVDLRCRYFNSEALEHEAGVLGTRLQPTFMMIINGICLNI